MDFEEKENDLEEENRVPAARSSSSSSLSSSLLNQSVSFDEEKLKGL